MTLRLSARLLSVLACLISPMFGEAATLKDIKIAIHVIDFVSNPPAGRNIVGVVYDPHFHESAEDGQSILESLTQALPHDPSSPKPQLIDIKDLDEAPGVRALIVTDHMKNFYEKLSIYGRHSGTLILSTDLDCVRGAKCTVGIASNPRVEVIVSTQQAKESNILFSEAFRMMVTEY